MYERRDRAEFQHVGTSPAQIVDWHFLFLLEGPEMLNPLENKDIPRVEQGKNEAYDFK